MSTCQQLSKACSGLQKTETGCERLHVLTFVWIVDIEQGCPRPSQASITGRMPCRQDGEWVHPPPMMLFMFMMEVCVSNCRKGLADCIATLPPGKFMNCGEAVWFSPRPHVLVALGRLFWRKRRQE